MKRSELLFLAVKPPLDYLALIFAAVTAYSVRYFQSIQSIRPVAFDLSFKDFFSIVLVIAFWWVIIFALSGLYGASGTRNTKDELARVFVACSAGLAFVLGVMVFSRFLFDSRFIIIMAWVLTIIFVSIERIVLKVIQKIAYNYGFGVRRLVIVGNGDTARVLENEFNGKKSLGYRVVEHFNEFNSAALARLTEMVKNNEIDEVIQINPNENAEQTLALVDFINENHIDFKYAADLLGTQLTNIEVMTYAGTPLVNVKKTKLDGWWRIIKRIFDVVFSIIFITLFSPIILMAGILVKLTSAGPMLFKYHRIGQYGKPFSYFKFRSMIKDAHKFRNDPGFLQQHENLRQGTPMMKFKDDPRITPFGKFIRRFSIDEMPEFFNVLFGKMSLVGPRPHEIEEVEKYQKHHKKLLTLKPGITGLAQVSGRSDLDFEEEVKLDIYYIENWSLGLDLQIILKTPLAVLKRRNAE